MVSFGSGFGAGSQRGDYAQLLKHAKHVVACPSLDRLAVLITVAVASGHGRVLVRWRDAHQLALVGASCGPAGHDLVALRDLVVDRDAYVGKRASVDLNELLQTVWPSELATRHIGVVEGSVDNRQLIDSRMLVLIPDLFQITNQKCLGYTGLHETYNHT